IQVTLAVNPVVGRMFPTPTFSPSGVPTLQTDVSDAVMSSFLSEAISRVNAAGFRSTVGHRFLGALDRFPTGTLQQFHYYARILDPNPSPDFGTPLPTLHGPSSSLDPAFVGELSARVPGEFPDDQGGLWPELNGRDNSRESILFERLTLLR